MPVILPEGIRVPAAGDAYALTDDLRKMAESARTIVPVANVTERAALVAALTAASRPPSATSPLHVHRADMSAVGGLEYTINGKDWLVISEYDTGWVAWLGLGGWAGNPEVRQIGKHVWNRGALTRVGAAVAANFAGVSAAILPSEISPPAGEVQSGLLSNIDRLGWRMLGTDLRIRAHAGAPSLTPNSYFTLNELHWMTD